MRCLALATALRDSGVKATFVCREHEGDSCCLIEQSGFTVNRLPRRPEDVEAAADPVHAVWLNGAWQEDAAQTRHALRGTGAGADWLVVDHYAIESGWEAALRSSAGRIMVIDDMANRRHEADLLLNQNLAIDGDKSYDDLVSPHCVKLRGPRYALLRPQFALSRANMRVRTGPVRRILVLFGGGDSSAAVMLAVSALRRLNRQDIAVDVVVGTADRTAPGCVRAELPWAKVYDRVANVAGLMAAADLGCGAAGSSTWERCCLGLPSLVISLATNQERIGVAAEEAGVARYLGRLTDVSIMSLEHAFREVIDAPSVLSRMSARGMALVDGHGAVRVAEAMMA